MINDSAHVGFKSNDSSIQLIIWFDSREMNIARTLGDANFRWISIFFQTQDVPAGRCGNSLFEIRNNVMHTSRVIVTITHKNCSRTHHHHWIITLSFKLEEEEETPTKLRWTDTKDFKYIP